MALHLFVTGNAGTGKSHLVKTIYHSLTKTFSYRANSLDKPKVLLIAPTGVAAININGTTMHTALGLPLGKKYTQLSHKKLSNLRNVLSEVRVIIIDEISMVSNVQLLFLHLRLCEIFACLDTKDFAGLTIMLLVIFSSFHLCLQNLFIVIIESNGKIYLIYGSFLKLLS